MDKGKLTVIFLWTPLVILGFLNLLTVFTPEIGFDALWYHLTLPKLWLLKKQWFFDGGLLYYSAMPRLAETLFIPLIKFTGYIGPKFVQYLSGIFTSILIWKIAKLLNFPKIYRLIAVSLFYCTWLVSWESGSAYIDLIRTLFETIALYYFILKSWSKGGIFLGLAVGTKWIALGSLGIYSMIYAPIIAIPTTIIALPWFIVAFYFTGNPIFPIFGPIIHNTFLSISQIVTNLVMAPYVLTKPFDDFISPIVGFIFIFSVVSIFKSPKNIRKIALVGVLGTLFSLTLNPPSTRFVLPYLPALIISAVYCLSVFFDKSIYISYSIIILSSYLVVGMRCIAISKYTPYILGKENVAEFITRYSARLPGTFIDSDGYVSRLPDGSKILVDRLHNLFYLDRDYDHTSWVKDQRGYDYLVTTGESVASVSGELLHTNQTGVQIFKLYK